MKKFFLWPQQSPINLEENNSHFVQFEPDFLKFSSDYNNEFNGKFEKKNCRVDFVLDPQKFRPQIRFNGKVATLKKIHLHTPSEHDLNGNNKDGDIHLLHQIDGTTDDAPEYLVIGVFFNIKSATTSSPSIQTFATSMVQLFEGSEQKPAQINPMNLIPKVVEGEKTWRWFWYEGSLTSPPYSENVTWVVLRDELETTDSEDFTKIKDAHQEERGIFDLNRRFILRNFN